ncbi:MAG TPA: glycosyltransferase family 4 protein [Acidimicrobiales bacterium]|nr:glycosyltransferase family 4 protein [Acidimicrobiales bacterium]
MADGLRRSWREIQESWERSRTIVVPGAVTPAPADPGGLRVAFLVYRGNPRCGGQGVYTRHLTRELVALGHAVTVFSGQPWPELDEGVGFVPLPGLDLYRDPDPFRLPHPRELRDLAGIAELGVMLTGGFGEPLAFSLRARRALRARRGEFDLVHDNQCLGTGMLGLLDDGWPLLTTLHHPITVDRKLALSHASGTWQRYTTRRWFGFLGMQTRVARRLPAVVTVSHSSRTDIAAQMGVPHERMTVVPVGVDHTVFRPRADVRPVPGRLMVTSSSDVPMKGLVPLLEAVARLRETRAVELVVVGRPQKGGRVERALERLGLRAAVRVVSGITDEELARCYGEAEVAVVPSLYEGFSLPAIEAMACGVPVVTTTGGALPEVVGRDGETAVLVPPDDPAALATAIAGLLDDPDARVRLGAAGRARVLRRFTWRVTAEGTASCYRALLRDGRRAPVAPGSSPEGEAVGAQGRRTTPWALDDTVPDSEAEAVSGTTPLTGAATC